MSRLNKVFAAACTEIANDVVDASGFVAMRQLVEPFRADIHSQPCLYEGAVAAPKNPSDRWLVILDSDERQFDRVRYLNETSESPLDVRLRFTIAHELAHMLAFRGNEFNIDIATLRGSKETNDDVIRRLEAQTDTVTPLLLVAEKALDEWTTSGEPLRLSDVLSARKRWAVSRDVVVTRLNLLRESDGRSLLYRRRLRDTAIGIGQLESSTTATLPDWPPTFCNFDGGVTPAFLIGHQSQRLSRLREAFPDQSFCLVGAHTTTYEGSVPAGTETNPKAEVMKILIEVEDVERTAGRRFLFVVRRVS